MKEKIEERIREVTLNMKVKKKMKGKKEKIKKVYSNLKMMMNFLVLALKRYRVHIRI